MAPWGAALAALLTTVVASSPTQAQPTGSARAMAETLFREARKLMKEDRFEEACRKLEDSYRMDPAGGTLLNLALCHEQEGKTATAWSEFKESLYLAGKSKRVDRQKIAKKHIEALEPLLPRLTVRRAKGAEVEGLTVKLDEVVLGEGSFDTALPQNPGEHTLTATAPGYETWEKKLTMVDAEEAAVVVPALTLLPPPPGAETPAKAPSHEGPPSWMRPAAFISGGVGVVALGFGAYFGARAISLADESDTRCKGGLCDAKGLGLYEDGKTAATVSNVAFGVGLVGVSAGVVLLVLSRESDDEAAPSADDGALHVAPLLGLGSAGLSARGAW